jgi:hypothetical protein
MQPHQSLSVATADCRVPALTPHATAVPDRPYHIERQAEQGQMSDAQACQLLAHQPQHSSPIAGQVDEKEQGRAHYARIRPKLQRAKAQAATRPYGYTYKDGLRTQVPNPLYKPPHTRPKMAVEFTPEFHASMDDVDDELAQLQPDDQRRHLHDASDDRHRSRFSTAKPLDQMEPVAYDHVIQSSATLSPQARATWQAVAARANRPDHPITLDE